MRGGRSIRATESKKAALPESQMKSMSPNWASIAIASGSNACNQCNLELELNSTTFVSANFPTTDQDQNRVITVSAGFNMSSAILSSFDGIKTGYIWGAGLPGIQMRVPTPIMVRNVAQISCGQDHAGIVTSDGKVYTWGSGENGILGHGSKQTVNVPKLVVAMKDLVCLQISCGGFHTAFIAAPSDQVSYTSISSDIAEEEIILRCGKLFCCGLSKAGQLGVGVVARQYLATPTPVPIPGSGEKAYRVSCGFHHTIVLGIGGWGGGPISSTVYCCGWGEYGRLGTGDEEQRHDLTAVKVAEDLFFIDIAAGEQHSLALVKNGSCYGWGNNSTGQLGIGNSTSTPQAVLPTKVPVPEGMFVTSICAGGRHSAAITQCGRLLSWGWGEEGQLGHGTEKNAALPRPCRLPRIEGVLGTPVAVSAGMSHTLVNIRNEDFINIPPPVKAPVKVLTVPIEVPECPIPIPEDIRAVSPPLPIRKIAIVAEDDEDLPINFSITEQPVRSVRELLQLRDERSSASAFVTDSIEFEKDDSFPLTGDIPVDLLCVEVTGDGDDDHSSERDEDVVQVEVEEEVEVRPTAASPAGVGSIPFETDEMVDADIADHPSAILLDNPAASDAFIQTDCVDETVAPAVSLIDTTAPVAPKTSVFYKDGQDYSRCLVANSARRAELRKIKKASQTK